MIRIDITNFSVKKIQNLINEYSERGFITHIFTTPIKTYLKIYNNML